MNLTILRVLWVIGLPILKYIKDGFINIVVKIAMDQFHRMFQLLSENIGFDSIMISIEFNHENSNHKLSV